MSTARTGIPHLSHGIPSTSLADRWAYELLEDNGEHKMREILMEIKGMRMEITFVRYYYLYVSVDHSHNFLRDETSSQVFYSADFP